MRYDQLKTAATDIGISLESATRMRIRYLQALLVRWDLYIDEATNIMPESSTMEILAEMISLQKYKEHLKSGINLKGITAEMIEQARAYPIDEMINFTRGTATAFCHVDKRPSLTWHKAKNRATCFPCGKSFSALDVLIERDSLNFVDAVKQLTRGF